MPPNLQRMLPMLLVFAAILFIVPALTKKHSKGPTGKTKVAATVEALGLVGNSEKSYLAGHGRYTSHLADLVALSPQLATDLGAGVSVAVDVSTDGKTFLAQVSSDQISLVRSRNASKVLAQSCTPLKSSCPAKKF